MFLVLDILPHTIPQHRRCGLLCGLLSFHNHQCHSLKTYINGKCSLNRSHHSTPLVASTIWIVCESLVTCALPNKCGIKSQMHSFGNTFICLLGFSLSWQTNRIFSLVGNAVTDILLRFAHDPGTFSLFGSFLSPYRYPRSLMRAAPCPNTLSPCNNSPLSRD